VHALDSTTMDLCLGLFPWGKFRRHKSAVKLHTLPGLLGRIPTNVYVTEGRFRKSIFWTKLLPEAGAFYLTASSSCAPSTGEVKLAETTLAIHSGGTIWFLCDGLLMVGQGGDADGEPFCGSFETR
jgi:hypothetical protein